MGYLIYDHRGRAVAGDRASFLAAGSPNSPAYEPISNRYRTRHYRPVNSGPNAIGEAAGNTLRAWSRDLVRKNPWASNALDSWCANSIGNGIVPRSLHPDATKRKNLHEWWLRWTDECDSNGLVDFYGMQSLVARGMMEGGETFTRVRRRFLTDGLFVPLQLQIMESEHVPLEYSLPDKDGIRVKWGIEFDQIARRRAYYVYPERPDESVINVINQAQPVRVDARNILHAYKVLRPGQQRGQPWLTPILIKLWELDQYDDAELVRKKVAAMVTYIIETQNAEDNFQMARETEDSPDSQDQVEIGQIEPGSTVQLPAGYKANPSQPAEVGGQYGEFMTWQLHAVAVGMGLSFEQVTGILKGVSFSSIRQGTLEFRRRATQFQHHCIVFQFCRPVWKHFIEGCVMAGLIDARDYAENTHDYLNVEWRPPRWDWVDPKNDIEAEVMAIDNLLKARGDTIAEMGEDAEEVDARIKADQDREKQLGLVRPQKATAAPADPKSKSRSEEEDEEQRKGKPEEVEAHLL